MHKEKRRSKTGSWRAIAQGSLLLLGIYMAAMLSLAFAVTRDMLKETVGMVPMYMSAMVAAWCGGKWTLKKIEPKANLYAIVPAALFCLIYIVFGAWMCDGAIHFQKVISFTMCAMFGGAISIMTTTKKKRKGKRVRKR